MTIDIEDRIRSLLKNRPPSGWSPSGCGKDLYVDLSEPIVRQAAAWQDGTGRIIDPFVHRETPTATARFVGAVGFLLRAGRCMDLSDACRKAMDAACEDLRQADRKPLVGAEFYVKELMAGYLALRDSVDGEQRKRWEMLLGGYDPEAAYQVVLSKVPPDRIHNYVTFALAGEACKSRHGIARNDAFMERHLENQVRRFTGAGMYRDPNDPMTYDAVARMNLSLMLHWRYEGGHRGFVDGMLRRGGLSMLLCASPSGEFPFGGRSNQQNFNEATTALLCEYEARRHAEAGDGRLAGAYKRMARLAALSVRRWLSMRPVRFNKNRFPIDCEHGRQKAYGFYGVYSLLIASQFGFAHLLADDSIAETPAPCELGGTVVRLHGAFHKVFATCGGYHVEIDTDADAHYDASGLGRIHKAGVPTELGTSSPITKTPEYLVTGSLPPRSVAIGPGWTDKHGTLHWLSEFTAGNDPASIDVLEESSAAVAFRLRYPGLAGCGSVTEEYRIDGDGVTVTDSIEDPEGDLYVQIPLLRTDGEGISKIGMAGNAFVVRYGEFLYKAECLAPLNATLSLEPFDAPNRNGIYRVGLFRTSVRRITYRISMTCP